MIRSLGGETKTKKRKGNIDRERLCLISERTVQRKSVFSPSPPLIWGLVAQLSRSGRRPLILRLPALPNKAKPHHPTTPAPAPAAQVEVINQEVPTSIVPSSAHPIQVIIGIIVVIINIITIIVSRHHHYHYLIQVIVIISTITFSLELFLS